jgi:hypothetical protein
MIEIIDDIISIFRKKVEIYNYLKICDLKGILTIDSLYCVPIFHQIKTNLMSHQSYCDIVKKVDLKEEQCCKKLIVHKIGKVGLEILNKEFGEKILSLSDIENNQRCMLTKKYDDEQKQLCEKFNKKYKKICKKNNKKNKMLQKIQSLIKELNPFVNEIVTIQDGIVKRYKQKYSGEQYKYLKFHDFSGNQDNYVRRLWNNDEEINLKNASDHIVTILKEIIKSNPKSIVEPILRYMKEEGGLVAELAMEFEIHFSDIFEYDSDDCYETRSYKDDAIDYKKYHYIAMDQAMLTLPSEGGFYPSYPWKIDFS